MVLWGGKGFISIPSDLKDMFQIILYRTTDCGRGYGRPPRPCTVRSPSHHGPSRRSAVPLTIVPLVHADHTTLSTLPGSCSAIIFMWETRWLFSETVEYATNHDRTVGRSFLGSWFLRTRSSRLQHSHLLVSTCKALNPHAACIHRFSAVASYLFRKTSQQESSRYRRSTVLWAPQPEYHPCRPRFYPSDHIHRSLCISLSWNYTTFPILYRRPSRAVSRVIERVCQNAEKLTLPVLPMAHIKVAPRSTQTPATSLLMFGESWLDDDTKALAARWESQYPEPLRRASLCFLH